ncbi:M14 family zinc carboxypeptidase [Neobacillus niacini]|uniref:M14 family zinc carboxypeptidase n=1 Tax=Neobacillus niacini TaxID=86668 RepID=UPI002FFEB15B
MKKRLAGLLVLIMMLSIFAQTAFPVLAIEAAEDFKVVGLEASRDLFSMTEVRTVEVQADFDKNVDLTKLQWTFGGKSISEWKKWTSGNNYNGDPFISVKEAPHFVDGTTTVKATLEFGLLFNRENLSGVRTRYQPFIGDYELALVSPENKTKAATTVTLNIYDQFLFYDQLKPEIDQIFAKAKADPDNNRYLEYQSLGKTVQGRDLHFVILAKDKKAVDKYLNETLPTALENPESLIKKLETGKMGDYQVPVWMNNIHPDEAEGVDVSAELLKKFALEDEVTLKTGKGANEKTVTMDVDEVLDDVIFLYMFTNNPDGRVANTRANANGFDLNRDNHYQTQVETQQVTQVIAKWTPLSFIDQHGYVSGFLIEPTTPPHNPNYEYDLLYQTMINQANAMGQAGIGNSKLTSYFIPAETWADGWDDATPAYTPMYAMLHGSLGHTIEVPELSQNGYRAMEGAGLGAAHFVTENKDQLFENQLEIFARGVKGEDNRAVDPYFINSKGESIGRVRGEHANFFPDYYVIPVDEKEQKNTHEAYKMVQYLIRNGVKVEQTTKNMKVNGKMYSKGTFIVPMKQAKRGVANAMLHKGENSSDWAAMYDPIVTNFPDLRGFDVHSIRIPDAFAKDTSRVEKVTLPTGQIVGNTPKQVLANTNNDTIKLVNELLKNGVVVEKATETKAGINRGDFIVNTKDLQSYGKNYYFEATPAGTTNHVKTEQLRQPKVAVTGSNQLNFSVRELGFNLVPQAEADVIISDSSSFNPNSISGKSFVGIGYPAVNAVRSSGALPGLAASRTAGGHEGLIKAVVNDHILTSGYEKNELLYTTQGAWITSVPEEAEVLASFSDADDFYVSGWWPKHEGAQGQTLAITKNFEDATITLYANDLAFRAHTQYSYRLIANSIYASVGTEVIKKGKGKGKVTGKEVKAQNNMIEKSFFEKGRDREN